MILKRLLFIATAIAVVAADTPAKAPKMTKEQEKVFDDVTVTLKNGDVERGKVTSYWNKTVGKTLNQDFKMKTDDGRELKLTYEDIDSICFPNRIKGYIKTWRVYNVATPKLGKKNAVSVWISGEGGALCTCTDHSSIDTTVCKARFSRCMDRISPTLPQTRQRQCSLPFLL